jgi:hypothetical protein
MAIKVWYAALGIVGIGGLVAAAGCSSSSTPTTTTPPPENEASTPDSSTESDTGTAAETSTADTSVEETSTTESGATDAATCSVALDTGSTDCDTCAATSCCSALMACDTADDAGLDEAGFSRCEGLLTCLNDVNNSDSGEDAGSTCDPSYTATEVTNATAVFTCLHTSCATQCPGL